MQANPLVAVLVLLNHYIWFRHFSDHQNQAYNQHSYYGAPENMPTFTEIASYFCLCVWLVPFALFVSLSASDNVLPTMGSEEPTTHGGAGRARRGQGMAKALVDSVRAAIGEVGAMAGWQRHDDHRL